VRLPFVAVLAVAAACFAGGIAVFDSEAVFDALGQVADARELIETEIEEWQAHADSLQADIDAIRLDLDRTMVMSPERRRDREALLEQKQGELEEFVASVFGPGGMVERRNLELVEPVIAAINEAVREISIEMDLDLVIDASGGFVVYADETLDITTRVIEELQSGLVGSDQSR
jgi:Skp family chaperone for outer membrane proteins